jgi:hypothetical protein
MLVSEDDIADDHLNREERSLKFAECPCQGAPRSIRSLSAARNRAATLALGFHLLC